MLKLAQRWKLNIIAQLLALEIRSATGHLCWIWVFSLGSSDLCRREAFSVSTEWTPLGSAENIRNFVLASKQKCISFMATAFPVEYTVIHLTDLSPCRKPYQNTCSWAGSWQGWEGRQSTTSDRWEECSWAWEAQPQRLHGTGDPPGCSWQEPQMYLCSQISTDLRLGESDNHKAQLSTLSSLTACCKHQIKSIRSSGITMTDGKDLLEVIIIISISL